jgi:hypothetical protein
MRRVLPFACLLLVAGCGRDEPVVAYKSRAVAVDVPESKALAGRDVKASESGGWNVRTARTARGATEAEHAVTGGAREGRPVPMSGGIAREELKDAEGARGADLGAVSDPVGAPAPSPAPPGAPPPASPPGWDGPGVLRKDKVGDLGSRATPPPSGLKAGATDDNADFKAYLEFYATWSDRADSAAKIDPLDVSDRRFIVVTDAAGLPFPGARIHLVDETRDVIAWEATTYGDGRAPFYPRAALGLAPGAKAATAPAGGWLVEVRTGTTLKQVRWDGNGETFRVQLPVKRNVNEPVRLDVAFLVDTTGSMGDEIERIKATLLEVTRRLKDLGREFELRYAAVLYKDLDDDYVTMAHPFTNDVDAFAKALAVMTASGGGDTPESLNQGLAEAVGRLTWAEGAAKVLFLVADASPHMDYDGDVPYGTSVKAAIGKGIRIHSVAASGLEPFGTIVFRQIAQATRGKFVFIEYGTPEASAAGHGVTGKVKSNNLDDILFEQIQDEIAAWGRAPTTAVPPGVSTSIR